MAFLVTTSAIAAVAPSSAFAYRYFQSEISTVPSGAPQAGPFANAFKVTTDAGGVFVLDSRPLGDADTVSKFDSSGSFVNQSAGEGGWLDTEPRLEGLAFNNSTGLAYLADSSDGSLWKLNASAVVQGRIPGPPTMWAPENQPAPCCDINVDVNNFPGPGAGQLYVSAASCCNRVYQGIYRVNANGQPVDFTSDASYVEGNHILGPGGNGEKGKFIDPVAVATTADGGFWVATGGRGVLYEFDAAGDLINTVTEFPIGEEDRAINDIASDPTNGHLLVAVGRPAQGWTQTAVWELGSDGSFIEEVVGPSAFNEPTGLAVDEAGRLYVADGSAVKVFGHDFTVPGITYETVTNQDQTSGTVNANLDPAGGGPVTTCEVEYGTSSSYGSVAPCVPDPAVSPPGSYFSAPTAVSANLSGLVPEQSYHYRFVAGNANAKKKGSDQIFTPHWVKGLDTGPTEGLTPTSAVLAGAFLGNGAPTSYHFEWGKNSGYGNSTPDQSAGSPAVPKSVQTTLNGLSPVTTYHYRISATNPDGTSTGDDESFTTSPLPPTVSEWVTDVHTDSVVFHALVGPGGGETHYQVEYVTDAAFQTGGFSEADQAFTVPAAAGTGFELRTVSTKVAGLDPGTAYHYRIVAGNSYKETVGPERTFTTFQYGGQLKDPCANSQVRQQTGAALLLDCRAYELVSSENTGGYDVESDIVPGESPFGGYPFALEPSRVLYGAHQGAIPGDWNPTNLGVDPYVATRTDGGWSTEYVGLPAQGIPSQRPFGSEVSGTSSELRTLAFAGAKSCKPCFADGKGGLPVRLPDGRIVQGMAGSMDPGSEAEAKLLVRKPLSADGKHLVFGSSNQFEPDAVSGQPAIYDRDLESATTRVVSKLPDGSNVPCLTDCGFAGVAELDISGDGSRILIGQLQSTDSKGNRYWHLYMNVGDSPETIDLMPGATHGALYDGMNAAGTLAYYTTGDQLNDDADSSTDIYRATISDDDASIERVSLGASGSGNTDACMPGLNNEYPFWNSLAAEATCDVVAIGGGSAVARDSGAIYFLSPELLDGSSNGTEGAPNLYLASDGSAPHFVATLESSLDVPQPPPTRHPMLRRVGELAAPTGIAFDAGRNAVYALQPGVFSGKVEKFDSQGHPLNFTAGSEAGSNTLTGVDTPSGGFLEYNVLGVANQLAVNESTGELLVPSPLAGNFSGTIERFSEAGQYLSSIAFGSLELPSGVAVDEATGDIYAATLFSSKVRIFNASGNPIQEFPTIPSPTSLAIDSLGHVYVANGTEAAVYDATGTFLHTLNVGVARGLAVDQADDHLYVDEGTQILEFESSGDPVGIAIKSPGMKSSTAVAAHGGMVLATDQEAGDVVVWGPPEVVPNSLYDSPTVLHAVEEPATQHLADFQATSSGKFAVFPSQLPLTGYDNDGHTELYLYSVETGAIDCVSCAPTGARASGNAGLPQKGLGVTEDGRVFFNSTEPLVPSDLNGSQDAFEWGDGTIAPISSGISPNDSSLLSVSADGADAYFFTRDVLVPQDGNGNAVKIYDARVNGGFLFNPSRLPCKASDECHGPGTQAAPQPDIGTYEGTGGNHLHPLKHRRRNHHRHRRRHNGRHKKRHGPHSERSRQGGQHG